MNDNKDTDSRMVETDDENYLTVKSLERELDDKTDMEIKIRKKVNLLYTTVISASAFIVILCILEIIFHVTDAPREVVYAMSICVLIGLISFVIDAVDFNKKRKGK
jgi:hypothetical protein